LSAFGCRNYSGPDEEVCSDRFECNHCQKMAALEELADTQRRLIELLKESNIF